MLLVVFGSDVDDVTDAVLATLVLELKVEAVVLMVMITNPPLVTVPSEQLTVPEA
jgi:hypothetical protein